MPAPAAKTDNTRRYSRGGPAAPPPATADNNKKQRLWWQQRREKREDWSGAEDVNMDNVETLM